MKIISLTRGKFAIVDDEDYEWLNQWKWYCDGDGYAVRNPGPRRNRTRIYMHRLINKTPDELQTDHINRDRLDNRKANLRNATRQQNNRNKVSAPGSSSRFKGVCWSKYAKKWISRTRVDGQQICLGYFDCELKAGLAYDEFAMKNYGEYARLNFSQLVRN